MIKENVCIQAQRDALEHYIKQNIHFKTKSMTVVAAQIDNEPLFQLNNRNFLKYIIQK